MLDFDPLSPIGDSMTSSTKPEVHNVFHCHQKTTESRPQVTCTEIIAFETYIQTRWMQHFTHIPGAKQSKDAHRNLPHRLYCIIVLYYYSTFRMSI